MQDQFREDLTYWIQQNPRTAKRLMDIIADAVRNPFQGIGKPEPLKGEFRGCWSRRLTDEDRVVYRVTDEFVDFLQGRYHYDP